MAISLVPVEYEKTVLIPFTRIVNKLKRLLLLTDVSVAAATDVSDLIADTYALLQTAGVEKFGPEARILVRRFEQLLRIMERLGLVTTAIIAALTTVNTAAAATDLRFLAATKISDSTVDVTVEDYGDQTGNFAYAVTG